MSFLSDYLKKRGADPRKEFSEEDRAALVWFLIETRLRGSISGLTLGIFRAPATLPQSERLERELSFVTSFLCFFISKGQPFVDDMKKFCDYYTLNFVSDTKKQQQLARAIRAPFFKATEKELEHAKSLDFYVDLSEMRAKTGV